MTPNRRRWIDRQVFISSTFRDMHAERDYLRHNVFPVITERMRNLHCHFEPIDLRGVDISGRGEDDEREFYILRVCLDEVEHSRPFMIILLGDRYGWVPPASAAARDGAYLGDHIGKSVTALEIEFGLLPGDNQKPPRPLFFFRKPLPYDQMSAQTAAKYSDAHGQTQESADNYSKLVALKKGITENPNYRRQVHYYEAAWDAQSGRVAGLEDFGAQVLSALDAQLTAYLETASERVPRGPLEEEQAAIEEFLEIRHRDFRGRRELTAELLSFLSAPPDSALKRGICLVGGPGTGKSAMFAHLVLELENDRGPLVLYHAAGITDDSRRVESMLRRWIHRGLGGDPGDDPSLGASMEEIENRFHDLLARTCERRRVILLVDGLDRFKTSIQAAYLTWMPKVWPSNLWVVATSQPNHASVELLTSRGEVELRELEALGLDTAAEVVRANCRRYHRDVNADVLSLLLRKKQTGNDAASFGNPLWLTLASEYLNSLDQQDFDLAEGTPAGVSVDATHQVWLRRAVELPAEVDTLYLRFIEKAETLHGRAVIRAFAYLLALSRFGLRQRDLMALVPVAAAKIDPNARLGDWDELKLATVRHAFRGNIVRHGVGQQWYFVHDQLRRTVCQQSDYRAVERQLHSLTVDYLESLPEDDPIFLSETMFHLIGSDDRLRTARFIAAWTLKAQGYRHFGIKAFAKFDHTTITDNIAEEHLFRALADHILNERNESGPAGAEYAMSLLDQDLGEDDRLIAAAGLLTIFRNYLFHKASTVLREKFLALLEQKLDQNGENAEAPPLTQKLLSDCLRLSGEVAEHAGDFGRASKKFARAVEISRKAVPSGAPLSVEDILAFGGMLERESSALHQAGQAEEAASKLREAIEVFKGGLPRDSDRLSNPLAVCLSHATIYALSAGRIAEAKALAEEALKIVRGLDLNLPDHRATLGFCLRDSAAVALASGDTESAARDFANAFDVARALSQSFPEHLLHALELAKISSDAGGAAFQRHDFRAAQRYYYQAFETLSALRGRDSQNEKLRSDFRATGLSAGIAIEEQIQASEAVFASDKARVKEIYALGALMLQRLCAVFPEAEFLHMLIICNDRFGQICYETGDANGAMIRFKENERLSAPLASADQIRPEIVSAFSVALDRIVGLSLATGDLPEARRACQASLAATEQAIQRWPRNPSAIVDMAISHSRFARLSQMEANVERFREHLKAAGHFLTTMEDDQIAFNKTAAAFCQVTLQLTELSGDDEQGLPIADLLLRAHRLADRFFLHEEQRIIVVRRSQAFHKAASALSGAGNLQESLSVLAREQELIEASDQRPLLLRNLYDQTVIFHKLKRAPELLDVAKRLTAVARTLNDQDLLISVLGDQARMLEERGLRRQAAGYLLEQASLLQSPADGAALSECLQRQSRLFREWGQIAVSLATAAELESLSQERQDSEGQLVALGCQLANFLLLGDQERVSQLLNYAGPLPEDPGNHERQRRLGTLSHLLASRGDVEGAIIIVKEAARFLRAAGQSIPLAFCLATQAAHDETAEKVEEGLAAIDESIELIARDGAAPIPEILARASRLRQRAASPPSESHLPVENDGREHMLQGVASIAGSRTSTAALRVAEYLCARTVLETDSRKREELVRGIDQLLCMYGGAEIAEREAIAIFTISIAESDANLHEEAAQRIGQLLERHETAGVALYQASALVNATIVDPQRAERLARSVQLLLNRFQTADFANLYASVLNNAIFAEADAGKRDQLLVLLDELFATHPTAEVARLSAKACVNAAARERSVSGCKDMVDRIERLYAKHAIPAIATELAGALAKLIELEPQPRERAPQIQRIDELRGSHDSQDIALIEADVYVSLAETGHDAAAVELAKEKIRKLLDAHPSAAVAARYAHALFISVSDERNWALSEKTARDIAALVGEYPHARIAIWQAGALHIASGVQSEVRKVEELATEIAQLLDRFPSDGIAYYLVPTLHNVTTYQSSPERDEKIRRQIDLVLQQYPSAADALQNSERRWRTAPE